MGMFDKVQVTCPRCGAFVLFQSKAGDCTLETYTLANVPPAIAGDLAGDYETCPGCGVSVEIHTHTHIYPVARENWS